jgi:hypothetical protein
MWENFYKLKVCIEDFRILFPRISVPVKPEYFIFFSSSFSMAPHSSADRHLVSSVFALPFQFSNLHVFIFLYTIPPSVFGRPLVDFHGDYYWLIDLNFLLLSILVTWPIQFNRLILTNEIITKSPNSCDNSLFYRFLQF